MMSSYTGSHPLSSEDVAADVLEPALLVVETPAILGEATFVGGTVIEPYPAPDSLSSGEFPNEHWIIDVGDVVHLTVTLPESIGEAAGVDLEIAKTETR